MATKLQSLKSQLNELSTDELEELASQAQEQAQKKALEPLLKEKEEVRQQIENLEEKLEPLKLRLDQIEGELADAMGIKRTKKGKPRKKTGCRQGSLRWHMNEAAKSPSFPQRFTIDDIFDAINDKVDAKSHESLWRQVVSTLSRCSEFRNISRGRGAKKGYWKLIS